MDKTLFFQREELTGHGDTHYQGGAYDAYWWTYPGANDPLAPDTQTDPFAEHRQSGGTIRKFFTMVKTLPDIWTAGKRKRDLQNILGADWTVDADEMLTGEAGASFEGVTYTGKFALLRDALCSDGSRRSLTQRMSWDRQFAEIKNRLAGKTWKICTQMDRWFYRTGRVEVQDPSKNRIGEITITADCSPWKYEMFSSMDLWEWDRLDFECGVIREREDYTLELQPDEIKSVAVIPLDKPEPVWICGNSSVETGNVVFLCWNGASMGVQYNNVTPQWLKTTFIPDASHYVLNAENRSDHTITVRIYYRGAMR